MITFTYPLAFALLLLPFIMALLPFTYNTKKRALYFSRLKPLEEAASSHKGSRSVVKASWIQRIMTYLVYSAIVLAIVKPMYVGEPIVKEESIREVLVCVDLSQSMDTVDFRLKNGKWVNRLKAEKAILTRFFDSLKQENFGLIFYGSAAFVQSPFTSDTNAIKRLLDEAQIGMAGPKTVIGDAVGLGVKLFKEGKNKERLMILMSDGSDTGSKIPPYTAAKLAKKYGIVIETIAVGNPNAQGEEKVDVKALQEIAHITGGNFYYATNTKRLENIYKKINKLHPRIVKKHSYRPTKELFTYPLMMAVFLLFSYLFFRFIYWTLRGPNVE